MEIAHRRIDAALTDLRRRLLSTNWVEATASTDRHLGIDERRIRKLVNQWANFDWEPVDERLQAMSWVTAGDSSHPISAIYQPTKAVGAATVVLLHGWPDSVLRFERVLPLLEDLHVVVPALPGFPFSAGRWEGTTSDIADSLDALIATLGHDRVVVSGGDIGAVLAEAWAARHPERVAALHLTDIPSHHFTGVPANTLSDEEQQFLHDSDEWLTTEGTYLLQQSSKPNTLAIGLGDSPAGLAAWIVEKLEAWSDGDFDETFPEQDLMTWLTAYWVTGTIGTSFAAYVAAAEHRAGAGEVPVIMSAFRRDPALTPRSLVERACNLIDWRPHPQGGHWPSWEQPALFVDDLRAAVRIGFPTS